MKSNRFATMMCFDQRRSTRNRIESKKFSRAHNPNIIRWISRKSEFWLWHLIAVLNHRTRNLCALLVTKFRQRASLSIRIDLRCASLFSGACVCVVLRKCKTERAFSHLGTCRCQLFCFVLLCYYFRWKYTLVCVFCLFLMSSIRVFTCCLLSLLLPLVVDVVKTIFVFCFCYDSLQVLFFSLLCILFSFWCLWFVFCFHHLFFFSPMHSWNFRAWFAAPFFLRF